MTPSIRLSLPRSGARAVRRTRDYRVVSKRTFVEARATAVSSRKRGCGQLAQTEHSVARHRRRPERMLRQIRTAVAEQKPRKRLCHNPAADRAEFARLNRL